MCKGYGVGHKFAGPDDVWKVSEKDHVHPRCKGGVQEEGCDILLLFCNSEM